MARNLIFGGTFDPIHHGHLITAQARRELLCIDEVIFVPAFISPHKTNQQAASGADRLEMVRLATQGIEGFRIYSGEIDRGDTSFTIDTINALKREEPTAEFTLLIGADQLPKLHTWHKIDEIFSTVHIAVLRRPDSQIPAQLLRHTLGDPNAEKLQSALLQTPLVEISATDIRARILAGRPIHFLVPPTVETYIRTHGLYANAAS